MADPQQDLIDAARIGGFRRASAALMQINGIVPPPPDRRIDPSVGAQERAHQIAIRIFAMDPDMDDVGDTVRKIRDRLASPDLPTVRAGADDPHAGFEAFVLNRQPPIHLCPRFFTTTDEQRIRTMLHETAHLVGFGSPDGEAYYAFYDGCPNGGGLGATQADSWSHFIHIVSGQTPDEPDSGPGHSLPVPPAQGDQTYTVVSGDYLSKIAQMFYGNGSLWRTIYDANIDVIGPNPNLIFPGQVLTIPPQ
jgi:hypothetical protein